MKELVWVSLPIQTPHLASAFAVSPAWEVGCHSSPLDGAIWVLILLHCDLKKPDFVLGPGRACTPLLGVRMQQVGFMVCQLT